MTYTTNYNFKKPDTTDLVKVSDLNDNADAIDAALAGKQDKIFEQVLELEVDWVAATIGAILGASTEVLLIGDQITTGGLLHNAVVVGLDVKISDTWINIHDRMYAAGKDFLLCNKPYTADDGGDVYTMIGHNIGLPTSVIDDASHIRIHYINTNGEEVVT